MRAGVYLHIPFCKSRCSYCDFATDIYRSGEATERYVDALCLELRNFQTRSVVANTIYFGGGTPSLLTPDQIERILSAICEQFLVTPDAEITMEMNPATVTAQTLAGYKSLGVNRASFGVQTFNDRHLKLLARGHDANDARQTLRMLREAGFANVSFDLIAGLPGQTLQDWERNLGEAVSLSPEHISLYLLEIHEGTPLAYQLRSGRRPLPDDEVAAQMYELMLDHLDAVGYRQYEISNFSRPGYASRHNSKYWTLDPVFGFGVSAHSFDGRERYANARDTAAYVDAIERSGTAEVFREPIDQPSEYLFLGLRMESGVDLSEYQARFGAGSLDKYRAAIDELVLSDLLSESNGRLRLTQKGKLFSNNVFAEFV